MRRRKRRPPSWILGLLAVTLGCLRLHQPVSVDPEATFAAHQEHDRLVVDRLERGRAGIVRPAGWVRWPGAPTFVLDADGARIAALWLSGSEATVRATASSTGPLVGEVVPDWEDGAVRLTLRPGGEPAFRTDPFVRKGSGGGPGLLTRTAQTVLDVRGTYEAVVRDPKAVAVGWMRVRLGPYRPAPRIYEAALPPALSPALVTAAAVALGAEIDWIEDHALNVYRGTGGGPLERSIPAPR